MPVSRNNSTSLSIDEVRNYTINSQVGELINFFDYHHLPEHLQSVSKPFKDLAMRIANHNNHSYEKIAAMRKLLEAKDAAVRAALTTGRD